MTSVDSGVTWSDPRDGFALAQNSGAPGGDPSVPRIRYSRLLGSDNAVGLEIVNEGTRIFRSEFYFDTELYDGQPLEPNCRENYVPLDALVWGTRPDC
jgi:hypothetical protein